ncbi:hypothetical protein IV67_GL001129 [Weissella minor]|uniref:Major facilitator superfamily (MFS) profile domain-containing protein n=1 Tax=Weissella minor TaxID=1620 RepID=A0A0R2JFC9_9LACO|nr:hypothetical protein IV67_GL001129 [Weissella minor]
MFNWLLASPDATERVPEDKIDSTYKKKQIGVLVATSFSYIAYYIIRLVFTTEQGAIMKEYGFQLHKLD